MAERQFGPYRLVRQIAVGGMAEIYLAKTTDARGVERHVALKMIHPNFAEDEQFIEMLIDEARISIQLHHPNIAHTFDLGRYGDTYYLIMEYVDGSDLYKILRRGSERDVVTPVDVAAFVVKEVALGLDYAHHRADEHGRPLSIVHRDVSPQNVILAYDGSVKLVDFGIAKAASKAQQTAAGVIKGKYYYMSPEQALGEPLDLRTDVFSAGIVLYELLSGQMLYLEEDVNRLLDRVRRADIPSIRTLRRDVPSQLERIVSRALARRREERYQSAADLAGDLERFLDVASPAFAPRKLVSYMQQALGDQAAPLLPTTVVPKTPPPRRLGGGARSPVVSMPEEFTDENSMIFRVADLGKSRRRAQDSTAPPPPARKGGRGAQQETAPIGHGDGDDVDSTTVSQRPARGPSRADDRSQTADEPPTSAAGPRGVRKAGGARPQPQPQPRPAPSVPAPGDASGFEMGDFEPTVIEAQPPAGVPPSAAGHPPARDDDGDDGDDGDPPDPDDDGPTFTRDAAPMLPVGGARARGPAQQPPALAARVRPPETSPARRPRESRRTPPGGTQAPSVLQAIVRQPGGPQPRPPAARGAGAPLSDGVPAPVAEAAPSSAPTGPAGGRGGAPAGGRGLSFGVQAGPLDPTFDAPTSPGVLPGALPPASPSPPSPPPPPSPPSTSNGDAPTWPGGPEPWPGGGQMTVAPAALPPGMQGAGYPPGMPLPPGAVPVYPYGPGYPHPGLPSISRQLMAVELDEASQYRLRPSGGTVFLRIALVAVVLLGLAAAIVLVVQGGGGGDERPRPSIVIESSPAGAIVLVDGLKLPDPTPTAFRDTAPGKRHEVELRLAGHQTHKDAVLMPDDGADVRLMIPLLARTVTLTVKTTPPGADVLVDDVLRGTSAAGAGLVIADLRPTDRPTRIEVRLKGRAPKVRTVEWGEDSAQTVEIAFDR